MASITPTELKDLGEARTAAFKDFLGSEPPKVNGEHLLALWDKVYDSTIRSVVCETQTGPSDDETNPIFPYQKLQAIIGDGGSWKWPRMWQKFDELERRGPAYRQGEKINFEQPNKNPNIIAQRVLVVGAGPVGLRMAIELVLGGHKVTIFEKRREKRLDDGRLEVLGFTNRVNRPHMWNFVRNDLARLNGKDLMSRQACYPVFTEPDTSSIGIDELQILLLKNALLLGVDVRLGVAYKDAKVITDPKSSRPYWNVECVYDEQAAQKYGKEVGANTQVYDVLVGCDGPRSTVRDTQQKHFGSIEKRKFMDCVGIVANVRKVPRKRLKEMGFDYGQEPNDMNRTKMVFKDFFDKIHTEANADLEGLIYYKASFHNYCILTPKRDSLRANGVSGQVYHHTVARDMASGKDQEKEVLKGFCRKVLKAAGIPVDETMENGGFVDAPNDCMAFDFAECWNTKKNMAFCLPPPDYNIEEHGPWCGDRLLPLVMLAGDALMEPFWPMGLGLKRGWQAIFDAVYAIDNLYNRTLEASRLGKDPNMFSWDDHYSALTDQIATNFEYCSRLLISQELGKGEYDEKGPVILQLKKKLKDAEVPCFDIEVDPWTRYAPLEKEQGDVWKTLMKDDKWVHPKVAKYLAMEDYMRERRKAGGAVGEIVYEGLKLVSVEGKTVATKSGYKFQAPQRKSTVNLDKPAVPAVLPTAELKEASDKFRDKLTDNVLSGKIDDHVQNLHKSKTTTRASTSRRASNVGAPQGMGAFMNQLGAAQGLHKDDDTMNELGHLAPDHAGDSVEDAAQAMWARMHGKHLSPAQEAELAHIQNMIAALTKSLSSYKEAEKKLLMKGSSS